MLKRRLSFPHLITSCSRFVCATIIILSVSVNLYADDDVMPPTHAQFVDSTVRVLADSILADFHPNRTRPIVMPRDTTAPYGVAFEGALERILSARGMLIRGDSGGMADEPGWSLRYTFERFDMSLTEPHRRQVLGTIWLKRALALSASVVVRDEIDGFEVWRGHAGTTYFDWVRKRDLKHLESGGVSYLAPAPPSSAWDRAIVPAATGLAAAAVTVLFFAFR